MHLFDCVMPCAGAEGFLVMREEQRAMRSGFPSRASSAPSSGTTPFPTTRSRCAAAGRSTATSSTRRRASAPADIDFVETYDDYPVINVMQLEDLGFCDKGEGAGVRARATPSRSAARFPLNTSGGQLSVGQAGAAGGYLGLVEAMRQLTGAAARRAGRGRASSVWSAASA